MKVLFIAILILIGGFEVHAQNSAPCPRALQALHDVVKTDGLSVRSNSFIVDRNLLDYAYSLGTPFLNYLLSLSNKNHILDAGCGLCLVTQLLYSKEHKDAFLAQPEKPTAIDIKTLNKLIQRPAEEQPHFTGVAYTPFPSPFNINTQTRQKLTFHQGRFFEDIQNAELLGVKGQFSLILDIFGVISYSDRPDVVLQKYFDLLAEDGVIFVQTHPVSILVQSQNGQTLRFKEWLAQSVPGIKILNYRGSILKITKDPQYKSRVVIPPLQLLPLPEEGLKTLPPQRVYSQLMQ